MSSIFQRLPAAFQKNSLLRIDQFRFSGENSEERGIELLYVFKDCPGAYVIRRGGGFPAGLQFLGREAGNTRYTRADILPEFGDGIPRVC